MTIKVTVTKDEEGSGDDVHVAIVRRDIYGNSSVHPGHIEKLETGQPREFYIHDTQELRVYETGKDLVTG